MVFRYTFQPHVEKDMDAIDPTTAIRILKKLQWFLQQDDPLQFATVLRQPAAGDIRFRVGDYRIVALLNLKEQELSIVQIAHRRDVYR